MPANKLPLVIDDLPLRKKLFLEASDLLKKIEKLEVERDQFHEKDLSLFQSWYDVTFKSEREKAQALYQEFEKLAKFHNSVLAQAEMKNQSLLEAVATLKKEQRQYENGTEAQKKKIEEKRRQRESFLEEAMKAQQDDFSDLEEDLEAEDFNQDQDQKQDSLPGYTFYKSILKALKNGWVEELLKLWDEAKEELHEEADLAFQEFHGASVYELIDHLKANRKNTKYFKDSPTPVPQIDTTANDIKTIYRRLARRLHPDVAKLQNKKITPAWIQQVWLRVQEAYKAQDVETLKRLDLTTLIRIEDLCSLSFDEIRASSTALKQELQDLKFAVRDVKKSPAWKFSTKRSYETIIKKIKEQLKKDLMPLKKDVDRLREMYGFFKM